MLNFLNLLASFKSPTHQAVRNGICIALVILMAISAIAAIILVLLQPTNSSGIDALGGSSETFFGKNKGKSVEAKLKKWTWICMAVLVVFSVAFFVVWELPVFFY